MKKDIHFSKERGGLTLVFVYSISVALLVLFIALSSKIFVNKSFSSRNIERMQALHIAESGLDYALSNLRDNYSWAPSGNLIPFENGEFLISVTTVGSKKLVESTGFIPDQANYREKKMLEAWMKEDIPSNFYDNAIYSSGEVDLNGTAYTINGDVVYYSELDNPSNITGTVTQDDTANPLAMLDFEDLYNKSAIQGNVYDVQRLKDVKDGTDSFPSSFWNTPPVIPGDPTTGDPNFVYIEGDLVLNGNIDIGGFFIVVGDVLNNPSAVYDATINGVGEIDGCVYTRGEFRINGGGGGLNIDGGVWSGTKTRINGNATVNYNADYMVALSASIQADAQLISWREINP
ncbi:MAG: hypothetical protein KJ593_00610 [Candidatus Omnitrophica bacterium]|nr:hypothetical protein [Candidatus Omnitrophota bacterium]